jgi:hypothetical protein
MRPKGRFHIYLVQCSSQYWKYFMIIQSTGTLEFNARRIKFAFDIGGQTCENQFKIILHHVSNVENSILYKVKHRIILNDITHQMTYFKYYTWTSGDQFVHLTKEIDV